MLVLSRSPGQKIYIGKDKEIEIEVIEVRGKIVRLGFTAPTSIPIQRDDVISDTPKH